MKIVNTPNREGAEIYERFYQPALLYDLKKTDKKAYQDMVQRWDEEYRMKIKALLQNYCFRYLGEGMTAVIQNSLKMGKACSYRSRCALPECNGWDKTCPLKPYEEMSFAQKWYRPRFLLSEETKTGVEFLDENMSLLTITHEDICWKSLEIFPEEIISTAKSLYCPYYIWIDSYEGGSAKVFWALTNDGIDDGNDIGLSGYIDKEGRIVGKLAWD